MNVPENIVEQIIDNRKKKIKKRIDQFNLQIKKLRNSAVKLTTEQDLAVKKIQSDHMDAVESALKELTRLELILEGLEKLNKTK